MSSLVNRITSLARSPKARELTERAQRAANSPETKAKIEKVRQRAARRK